MSFFRRFMRFKQTQDIQELTDFLAQNETFKNTAKKLHNNKTSFFKNIDSYLEEELLGKKKAEVKRITDTTQKQQNSNGGGWGFWNKK